MSNAPEFLRDFVKATSAQRAQMIHTITQNTTDPRIKNLFSNINLNDVSVKNRNHPDSIHFICDQLRAFIGLRLNWH